MSFDPVSYLIGKQAGGGGGGATVEPLSVSENGTYTAPGKAFSPVTVNVQTPVVDESKPIRFYDYDGTLWYSYTLQELQALTELPAQPEHEGLTATGWNWTLAELKAENAPVIVGGHYRTTDGANRIYIKINNDDQRKIDLYFRLNGTAKIDWGDGSAVETLTLSMPLTDTPPLIVHEYATTGEYCIKITVTDGVIGGGYSDKNILKFPQKESQLTQANNPTSANFLITKIEGGDDHTGYSFRSAFTKSNAETIAIPSKAWMTVNDDQLVGFEDNYRLKFLSIPSGVVGVVGLENSYNVNLRVVSLPRSITYIGKSASYPAFNQCTALEEIAIPSQVTSIDSAFKNCYSLRRVDLPSGVTSIGASAFNSCYSLQSIDLPSGVTSIGDSAFYSCYSLLNVKIPRLVREIGNQAFNHCKNVVTYDFTDWTTADLDACSFGTNIFQNLTADTSILFKYKSVADHAATVTNLATYASYMTYEEDDT